MSGVELNSASALCLHWAGCCSLQPVDSVFSARRGISLLAGARLHAGLPKLAANTLTSIRPPHHAVVAGFMKSGKCTAPGHT